MATQQQVYKDVKSILICIKEKGNSFIEDSKDLLTMHNKVIMSSEVVNSVQSAKEKGQDEWRSFANRELGRFYEVIDQIIFLFCRAREF